MEYEATRPMPAESRIVFDAASDTSTMHHWIPDDVDVHEMGPGVRETDGRFTGMDRERNGLVRASADRLRLEWGSRDRPDYSGWLQVTDRPDGRSEAVLHLSFLGDQPPATGGTETRNRTQRMLQESLDRLADEVGRRVTRPRA